MNLSAFLSRVLSPVLSRSPSRAPITRRDRARPAAFASSAIALLALAGCGKRADAPPPAASAPSVAASPASAPLKIAFAYIGPVGDGGWTYAHDRARKALEAALPGRVTTSYVEKVPEGADAERVIRDMAGQGATLIFGTTYGYMEPMLRLAGELPQVKFEHATGYKQAANLRTYDSRTYEGAYLAGVLAGAMTKTDTLGVVASVPIPEVIRNIDAYTLGARSVNPKVHTRVVWVNEWFNPPKETEAAQALIDGGADVLMQNTDSSAVLQTAEKNGKYAFGWDSDMTAYGPKAHLASSVNIWGPYYIKAAKDALAGTWTTGHTWWGVKEGAIDLVSIATDVPPSALAQVAKAKAGLKDGSFAIWAGPIAAANGKPLVAAGTTADDAFLAKLDTYVDGVEGTPPGAK